MTTRLGGLLALAAACAHLCLVSVSLADDRRIDKSRLVVMTFNAEFMWDGVAPEEGQVQFDRKGDPDAADEHFAKVAQVIINADADIVNLIEVENAAALSRLNSHFLQGRGYVPYFVQGRDSTTGQDVALLTRIDPVGGAIRYDDRKGRSGQTLKGVSKNYVARFEVGALKFSVIGLHFLAFPNDERRAPEREAQSDAVRLIALDEVAAGYEVIVLGDFNDYDGSPEAMDHIDHRPRTRVMSLLRDMDPATLGDDLVNCSQWIPKAVRYTAYWDQDGDNRLDMPHEASSIDHILLNRPLANKVDVVRIPRDHSPPDTSDHWAVVATINTGDASPAASGAGGTGGTVHTGLRIIELMPNPAGDENQNEWATLKYFAAGSISLAGWRLRDAANTTWDLRIDGSLAAGAALKIMRKGRKMGMNNSGDTIDLVNPSGAVVQRVQFAQVAEGEIVVVGVTDAPPNVWINEFHCDNAGEDINEFVELCGAAGTTLDGWSIIGYSGESGKPYKEMRIGGRIADESGGFGTIVVNFPEMKNGPADGLALVDAAGHVIEFLSYRGTVLATAGPAAGTQSDDIGVSENPLTSVGHSLQRSGAGKQRFDFSWRGPRPSSAGRMNDDQVARP